MAGMELGAGALDLAETTVRNTRESLDARLKNLRQVIMDAQGIWKGQAATTFQQLMAQWDEDSGKTVSALENFETNLHTTKQQYQQGEEEMAADITRAGQSADYSTAF